MNEQQFQEALAARDQQIARLSEALILREAKELVREALARTGLPAITQGRLLTRLAANPPLQDNALDGAALMERVRVEVEAETAYLREVSGVGGAVVSGMGAEPSQSAPTAEQTNQRLSESLQRLGLSQNGAAIAAAGAWR